MNSNIENKIVVISGGAAGIGFEIAKAFLDKNAKVVVILDINENLGEDAVRTLNLKYGNYKSSFIKCDVTKDLETVSKIIFHKYEYVDILVNNAGTIDEINVSKAIDINVTSLIKWTFKFYDKMRVDAGGKGGTIFNLASIYAYRQDPYVPVYKASKYAVMGFTRTLGHSYNFERTSVRVIAICPGFTYTTLTSNIIMRNDEVLQNHMKDFTKKEAIWQNAEAVGNAAVKIYEIAKSGTAWEVEGDQPIKEVL